MDQARQLRKTKDAARLAWGVGNYQAVAELIWDVGEWLVERMAVGEGEIVLDVGAGTGNAAIRAAQAGATVCACDIARPLLDQGSDLAAAAGVQVEWIEGDAEELPFPDAAFDVVLSIFGQMHAPRQARAAAEIARVTRPGGRFGLCSWVPGGFTDLLLDDINAHLHLQPYDSPSRWGNPEVVRELFASHPIALEFEVRPIAIDYPGPEQAVEFYAERLGPLARVKQALVAEKRWEPLRRALVERFAAHGSPSEAGIRIDDSYLLAAGTRTA